MAWTTPKDWATNELVTAANMNAHLRDNLNYLLAGRTIGWALVTGAGYGTSSTSFVDVDATNLSITQTLTSSRVAVLAWGCVSANPYSSIAYLDIIVDNTNRMGHATDGLLKWQMNTGNNGLTVPFCIAGRASGLSAASHTFKLQWKASASAIYLYYTIGMLLLEV